MKNRLLSLLLAAAVLPAAFAQNATVQKTPHTATPPDRLTDSSKVIVVGDGGSISATGTGVIAATSVAGGSISPTAPLTGGGPISGTVVIGIPKATSSVDGYLFHTDWTTFNAKQSALTFTAPIVNTAGTVAMAAATGSVNGYLTSADWTTFNAKQAAGNYLTALTGDATAAGPGSAALTLATVNGNVGTFAAHTVNAKGLTTAAANLSGDLTTSGAVATLATVNSNVGTFGDAANVAQVTVNAKGLVTAVANVAILPSQTGNSGKFLTTNGTSTSWSASLVTSIAGTAGQITASASNGAVTLSIPSSLTGVSTITAATNADLTLTPGGSTNNVVVANTSNQNTRLDLGIGPAPTPTPSSAYFQPLIWSSGSRYTLDGGYSLFTTAAYPAGIYDYLGGIAYNMKNSPVSGDVQYALAFESRFQNDPVGTDTEFYYAWNGPVGVSPDSGGRNSRRIFQNNTSWGTAYAAPSSRPMGYSNISFDVNSFALYNGAGGSNPALSLDFGNNSGTQAGYTWHWWGGTAARFDGGLSTTNIVSNVSTGSSSIGGNTTILSNNASFTFTTGAGSGSDAIYSAGDAVNGDSALRLGRNGLDGNEYMAFGASASGSLIGGTGYYLDLVRGSSVSTPFFIRYSSNGGHLASGTYTTVMQITPSSAGQVSFPINTASTDPGTGAIIVTGGVGVVGAINNQGGVNVRQNDGTSTVAKLSAASNTAALTLNSAAAGNFRYVDFQFGPTPTSQWKLGYSGFFPSGWVGFNNGVNGGAVMVDPNNNVYIGNTNTTMSGSYNLALEGGVIDTRTTAAIVLKQNGTTALTIANSTLNATFASTTDSTTSANGGAIFSGGVGIAKSLNVGSTTDSFSSVTGAETVAGGLGVAKALYVGTTINAATSVTSPSFVGALTGTASTATALATARTLWGQSFDGTGNVSGSLTGVGNITGGASSMTITAGTGNSRTLALQSTTSGGTATTFLTGNADQSVTFVGAVSGITTYASTGNMTISGTSSVFSTAGTTEASTGGAGSINTVGGIFAAKKIVTTSTLQVSSGSTTPLDVSATGANAFISMNADQAMFLSSVGPDPATVGTQTKDSVYLALRGSYWNGASSSSLDCAIINEVVSTAPLYKLAFRTGNTDRLTIDNAGLIAALVATDASSSTVAAFTITGGLGVAKKLYAGDDVHGLGNVLIDTAGKTLSVKSGANAAAGTVTLVAGAATITSTAIDANTVIVFSEKTAGGTPGVYQPLAAVSSGSAAVTSAATDTSTYNWVAMKVN